MRARDAKDAKPEDRPSWFTPRTRAFADGAIGHAQSQQANRQGAKVGKVSRRERVRRFVARMAAQRAKADAVKAAQDVTADGGNEQPDTTAPPA